jgi:SAM-dependent methyltransferase
MDEILRTLGVGALVLDLGCAKGSFPANLTCATVVRLDREASGDGSGAPAFVQGDAKALPFADHTFASVISNHSLEHFDDLDSALHEIGRVIAPDGSLFVSVPDASTMTDRLYRWLARGGGHVNAFKASEQTAALIERATGLRHVATRLLCSSCSFLNRRNGIHRAPRRLRWLGAGYEWSLFLYAWLSRRFDRVFRTRTSVYGWAFYFGNIPDAIDTRAWANVCIRCGAGFAVVSLLGEALVHLKYGVRAYQCPRCGASNPFADDLQIW